MASRGGHVDGGRKPSSDPVPGSGGTEAAERDGQPERDVGVADRDRPVEGSSQVRDLPVDRVQRFVFGRRNEASFGVECDYEVVLGVASSDDVTDAGVVEPFERVLPDRLEEAVAALVTALLGDNERLVNQLTHKSSTSTPDAIASHDGFGGVEGEAAREHAEAVEDTPLQRCQEVVRPVDRLSQRLMALDRGAAPAREQAKPFVEPRRNLSRRHHPRPGSRQLERQRDPVEPCADLRHRRVMTNVELESPTGLSRAVHEQPDRATQADRATAPSSAAPRAAQALRGWSRALARPDTHEQSHQQSEPRP